MFILYALPIGLLLGFVSGGRVTGLSEVRFRWAPLALLGLLAQVILFFGPVAEAVAWLGMPIYVGSTLLVLVAVLRNAARPGLAVVAVGACSNLLAIVANGGYMPASPAAMAALGKAVNEGYSNSAVMVEPMLWPLTDIFALPRGVPFANVFSVGDVLIGLGVAWAIAAAMHLPARGTVSTRAVGSAFMSGIRRQITAAPPRDLATAGAAVAAVAAAPGTVHARTVTTPPAATGTPATGAPVTRLSPVALGEAWEDDLQLASWLAENVDLVGQAAGMELREGQVLESERPVVLAEHDGQSVVIVSERGPASDDAFGCLVRHVAACQAELGIWVCQDAADQHAATVAWLNVATGISFAMLTLAAVRIGDSPIAAMISSAIRAPRGDDPRYSMDDNGRVAGAGRRAGDWLRRG